MLMLAVLAYRRKIIPNMYTIYPTPGSFNDFSARNPEIVDRTERLHHLSLEMSMWRATSPDIDRRTATLTIGETAIRQGIDAELAKGGDVRVLRVWPKVGEYDVPAILAPAA